MNAVNRSPAAKRLTEILGLKRAPVAVRFIPQGEDLPSGFTSPEGVRYCQILMKASEGEQVLLTPDTIEINAPDGFIRQQGCCVSGYVDAIGGNCFISFYDPLDFLVQDSFGDIPSIFFNRWLPAVRQGSKLMHEVDEIFLSTPTRYMR